MTPVMALGILSGSQMPLPLAGAFVLITMVLSDITLGLVMLHAPWNTSHAFLAFSVLTPFVYGSIAVSLLIAKKFLWGSTSLLRTNAIAVVSALQFWVVTNFAVWLCSGMYPMTSQGLADCFALALPFLKWQLLGDVVYSTAALLVYRLVINKIKFFRSGERGPLLNQDSLDASP
jgi:hypothetical protein